MSAYFSPNHNRLLDLENHLQRQQPAPRPSSPPARRSQRQNISQAFNAQPLAHVGERVSTMPPPTPTVTTRGASGSYRQLASQMGQHYYPRRSVALKTQQTLAKNNLAKNELPVIPTPISLDVVETFEAMPVSQPSPQPSPRPSPQPSSRSSSQPSWTGLAQSIRRARLGLAEPASESTETEARGLPPERQPIAADWALDEIFTVDEPEGNDALAQPCQGKIAHAVPVEILAQDDSRTGAIASTEATPNTPVTIDVVPVKKQLEKSEISAPSPAPTSEEDTDTNRLKNGLLLLTYQLACPPQIVNYLAQFYRQKWPKTHKRKHPKIPIGGH